MPTRHVRRRPAKPIESNTRGWLGHFKRFGLSFTPRYFRAYWMSRAGVVRMAKLAGLGFLFVFLVFLWYAKDLPSPSKINAAISAQTTKFYARDELENPGHGTLLFEVYGDKNRTVVPFDQIPTNVKQATIAVEDKDFYKHGAFSIFGIGRALTGVVTGDRSKGGGSTITQQYVKNALLTDEYSISRKIKELILAIEIEQFYSKDDILKLYLNEIPYGSQAYGIQSAAQTYFKTDAKSLTLAQAALLAGIPRAPSYYSPYGSHVDALLDRQHLILDLMAEQGYITKQQAADAKAVDVLKPGTGPGQFQGQQNLYANIKAPHFVIDLETQLENKYGVKQVTEGGLKIITTIDWSKQQAAEQAISDSMAKVRASQGSNAALVATDPTTGQVLAEVGSYNYGDPQFGNVNVATAKRQPGSSFKPIVYSTLFAKNKDASCAKTRACPTYGPGTVLYDVKTQFGVNPDGSPFAPQNFGNALHGTQTARSALAGSLNIPAVKALVMAGESDSMDTAQRLGITTLTESPDHYGLSLVLGTGEVELVQMANAYESFANGGLHYEQTSVLKITDQKNNVLEDNTKPAKPKQALDPQVAYLMADVLSDYNAKRQVFGRDLDIVGGCANNAATGCIHVGSKTGTTEHFNDAWTLGFTPNLVAGVWVGNNNNAPMRLAAADIAAPIWVKFMNAVNSASGVKSTDAFVKPSGIQTLTLDHDTGRATTSSTKTPFVDIFPSWYVPMSSSSDKSADVDKVSGNLATACTPPLARTTVYSSAILPEITQKENSFQYQNWLNALIAAGYATSGTAIPTDSDTIHDCGDMLPKVSLTGTSGGGPYTFHAKVTLGTFGTSKTGTGSPQLQVYFDDQIIYTNSDAGSGTYDIPYSPTSNGSHTVKAVITDTGLYQGDDQDTVLVTHAGNSFQGLSPSDGDEVAAGLVNFTWSSSTGASVYSLFVDGALKGTSTGTSFPVALTTKKTYTWFVRDDIGNQTSLISFKAK